MVTKLTSAIVICLAIQVYAADQVPGEYQVKGAFLLNFAKFVEWPPGTFLTPTAPIEICVFGENPFGPGLERAVKDTVVANRPVTFRQVSGSQEASHCQIVFVGGSEHKRARGLLEAVQDSPVLTVGESDGFLASGGVVTFKLEGQKVRIEISTAAADRAKLHISAKLLSLAQAWKR